MITWVTIWHKVSRQSQFPVTWTFLPESYNPYLFVKRDITKGTDTLSNGVMLLIGTRSLPSMVSTYYLLKITTTENICASKQLFKLILRKKNPTETPQNRKPSMYIYLNRGAIQWLGIQNEIGKFIECQHI